MPAGLEHAAGTARLSVSEFRATPTDAPDNEGFLWKAIAVLQVLRRLKIKEFRVGTRIATESGARSLIQLRGQG